ncbi:hypothetical protein [Neorhizobium galegae]|uniref:hypothetical protein n=1 Tax=Neorhizobium galegae TaxID=399 RepID=UPI000622A8C3|nr:hypothetical protein [Neorhizobium galegae]CDZ54055.1 Hypothetical protein NGAL_HAMBI2427_54560 [Neorhizobium galegae bv. orientalis]
MPFYLVTQTSLIEADDEESAAIAVLEKISSSATVAFTVKLDDNHVSHTVVSRPPDGRLPAKLDDIKEPAEVKAGSGSLAQPSQAQRPTGFPLSAKLVAIVLACVSVGFVSGLMLA